MIEPQTTALILLAAGRSIRFGAQDKLEQSWLGQPLGTHIAKALEAIPFGKRVAVGSESKHDYRACGYSLVTNGRPEQGLSRSIGLGVEAGRGAAIEAVMIMLADMPRVTSAHVRRLFDLEYGATTIVASSDGRHLQPPALFGADRFETLLRLEGDRGARDLIGGGRHVVVADADELIDIDDTHQLLDLRIRFGR